MASYIPNSSHRLNERPHTPKQDTGSASIAPVHRYLTTNPVGRQYTASEYSMRRGHPVGSSSAEEYEGDLSLWQLEGNVDGMLTPARRVCHVCGVRVTPQLSCPSCGHPMCGSCGPEVVKARGLRGEDEMGVDKVKKAGQPGSVKHNPFVIADQIASSKTPKPNTHRSNISTPLSKPPKYDLTHHDRSSHEHQHHNLWDNQPGRLSHSHIIPSPVRDRSGLSEASHAADKHTTATNPPSTSMTPPSPAPISAVTTAVNSSSKTPTRIPEAKEPALLPHPPSPPRTPIAARRRLFEGAFDTDTNAQPKSSATTPNKKQHPTGTPNVTTKPETTVGSSSHSSVPRVRVRASSPPAWLRDPSSTTPSGSPSAGARGVVPGNLKTREGLRSSLLGSEESGSSRIHTGKGKGVEYPTVNSGSAPGTGTVAGWMPSPSTPSRMVSVLGGGQEGSGGSASTVVGVDDKEVKAGREMGGKAPGASILGSSVSVSRIEPDDAMAHVAPLRRSKPVVSVGTSEEGVPVARGVLELAQHHGDGESLQEAERVAEEVGIEGLTIVLHLRGREDLVISADMRGGGQA